MSTPTHFQTLLTAARGDRTQAEVAQAAGISPGYLSDLEAGKKPPTASVVGDLLGALGISGEDASTLVGAAKAAYLHRGGWDPLEALLGGGRR